MACGRGVKLLLEHALVYRADGELRAAEDLRLDALGVGEGVLRRDLAGPAADLLCAIGPLIEVVSLAPLLRAVCVVDRHAYYGDRGVHTSQRPDAGNAPPRAHDHPPVDLLAQDGVGAAHVAGSFG